MQVEDAFVGILASESALAPTDISELIQDPPAGRAQVPALFAGQVLVHRVADFRAAFAWLTFAVRTAFQKREERGEERRSGRRGTGSNRARRRARYK